MFFLLYKLLSVPNILKYQTFRGLASVFTAFFISFLWGDNLIQYLKKFQSQGQPIYEYGPENHLKTKKGTPTMGGILIVLSVLISTLLWSNLLNPLIWIALLSMIGFGAIGFFDDIQKIKLYSSKGVSARHKFIMQWAVGLIVTGLSMFIIKDFSIYVPFFKSLIIPISYLFILWGTFVIVGSSNAVNLTDGLDGLAIFPVMIASIVLGIMAYISGHAQFSDYLFLKHIPYAGELVIFLGAWIGASLGFLWFNAPPAKIFMGDTGSLAAGASLATVAVMIKQEIMFGILGGVFVLETLSVIIQVFFFKTQKRRIFLMTPIHHHFEKKGWHESTIVIRFWIISVLLALFSLASLKVR